MIQGFYYSLQEKIFTRCESFTNRKHWIIILAVSLPFVVLFFSFPSYERLNTEFAESWNALQLQADAPLTDHSYNPLSHQAKLTFRLTMPLVVRVLNLNTTGVIIFQGLMGILLFYFSTKLFLRITGDKITALLLTLSVAFIYAGRVSFNEIRGIFDGFALLFLVLSMYFKNPVLILVSVFLAAWTDERALIASCLVFLFWIYSNKSEQWQSKIFNLHSLAVLGGWIAYFATRFYISTTYGLTTHGVDMVYYFIEQTNNLPLGIWSALEGDWLLMAAAFYVLLKNREYMFSLFFAGGTLIILIVGMSVIDITRSMCYLLPALFIALLIIKEFVNPELFRKLVLMAVIMSFIYPAYNTNGSYFSNWTYPLPLQLLRYAFA